MIFSSRVETLRVANLLLRNLPYENQKNIFNPCNKKSHVMSYHLYSMKLIGYWFQERK